MSAAMVAGLTPGAAEQLALMVEVEPVALETESERRRLHYEAGGDNPAYVALRAAGWRWEVAVYIVWSSMPKTLREPRTQGELARDVLGLASDRVIGTWRRRNPAIDEAVARLQAQALLDARGAIMEALVESATNPDHKNHPDRRLALEMLGDYTPRQDVTAKIGPVAVDEMDEAELLAIAAAAGE